MFCFRFYLRVLDILLRTENTKYADKRDIRVKADMANEYSLFSIHMIHNSYFIRTNLTNERKYLDMLFMITDHIYYIHSIISKPELYIDVDYIHILPDQMIRDFKHGIDQFFGEDTPNEYEGDDYQDILKKFHYSSLDMNPREYETFFDSLNNMELMRIMKLVSYHRGYPDEALHFFQMEDNDMSKIYTITRIQEMIHELDQIMDQRGENHRSKNLLTLYFHDYVSNKKEEKVLGLLHHYGYEYIELSDKIFSDIISSNMKEVIFNMIVKGKVSIETFSSKMLFANGYQIDNFDRLINFLYLPMHLQHKYSYIEKKQILDIIVNIRLLKMIAKKDYTNIPSFLDKNPNLTFYVSTTFIRELIHKDEIPIIHRLFSQNLLRLDILEKFHFEEIFLLHTTKEMFMTMMPYIPLHILMKMRFEQFITSIIKDLSFKQKSRHSYIARSLPIQTHDDIKHMISTYLV